MTIAGPTGPPGTGSDPAAERAPAEGATRAEPAPTPPEGPHEPPERPARAAPEPEYGFPRALWRGLARIPVPPPADPRTWRSTLLVTWHASDFGGADVG